MIWIGVWVATLVCGTAVDSMALIGLREPDSTQRTVDDFRARPIDGGPFRTGTRAASSGSRSPWQIPLALVVTGNAEVSGNLCLDGHAHVNGDAMGNNPAQEPHFVCNYSYTEGFFIPPPSIYTDPEHFPDATYYDVRGNEIGGTYQARIFDAEGADITTALGDSLTSVTTYVDSTGIFMFKFDTGSLIEHYFDDESGVFRRNPSDAATIVNFGEPPIAPPGACYSSLVFDGDVSSEIHATILNTRFLGTTEEERIDCHFWGGAEVVCIQIAFEPFNGISMIAHDVMKVGSSHVWFGSEDWPALMYLTRDVAGINANFHLVGSGICLRDFMNVGGPDAVFNGAFHANLPDYLQEWIPALGACCMGDSCALLTDDLCIDAGGAFQGENTPCNPNPCVHPEACCHADSSCSFVTADSCATVGGSPQGEGTTCDPNPCATSNVVENEPDSPIFLAVSPNPTSGPVTIAYGIAVAGLVAVDLFCPSGQRVKLVHAGEETAGRHVISWDGTDDGGRQVPSGIYFMRLVSAGRVVTRPVMLAK